MVDDPYHQLRPEPPTPVEELCQCTPLPSIVVYFLGSNPLHCLNCNREVPPERLGMPSSLAESLAFWRDFYRAFDTLWLDSGEFEAFARRELADPESVVNRRGLDLVARLAPYAPSYLAWFQDAGADDFRRAANCPRCNHGLEPLFRAMVCNSCRIALLQ